jgi:hypothetical protein
MTGTLSWVLRNPNQNQAGERCFEGERVEVELGRNKCIVYMDSMHWTIQQVVSMCLGPFQVECFISPVMGQNNGMSNA